MNELVFAVPTQRLWELLPYQKTGFIQPHDGVLNQVVAYGLFRTRHTLEEDPSFKQLIPYGIITHHESYYLFQRSSKQREKRLHHNLHLGVGGHMNPWSGRESAEAYVLHELQRELFEEVRFSDACKVERMTFIGLINDDSIEVGRMHIGLLYDIRVSNKTIVVRETDKMTGQWIDKAELLKRYQTLETWTQIAIDACIR